MLRFLVKRTLLAVLTLISISVVTFLLFFAVPSDPASIMCGKSCAPAQLQQTRERLGITDPLHEQYGNFVKGIFVGRTYGQGELARECAAPCLGYSFRTSEPVVDILERTLPVTISIVGGAAAVYILLGIGLGMFSALKKGTVFDKTLIGISLTGASMQIFFLGLVLMLIFVYGLRWLPNPGYTPITEDPVQWALGLLLPWITLGFINSAIYARLSRAQMIETLSEDYIRTARAKGLRPAVVSRKHALRAAITPLVTFAGIDIGAQLGGTFITETTFGINGLGRTAVRAVEDLNLPIVMATVLLAAIFIVTANVIVDVLYAVIDPRIRLS